ncbi:AAA family ATPase [Kutzneria sp. CA-103260]|uniref:AAA family ATPase n=1 Tax=Kutzneria sp. CA-103260 TaxID=2802641 RepID=UPI001BAAFB9D|nr:LuxR family transcriptional regulator [Kutzneria sp. CA-103260]QUQ63750.1 AAA ATPase domain protein [Kutzneria sp. CA-103260]
MSKHARIVFLVPVAVMPASGTEAPRLVGRDEALADVLAGAAPVTLVTGPAGIGRSALLAAVRAELVRRDVTVVEIRLTQPEHAQPRAGLLRLGNELLGLRRQWLPTANADTRPVLAKAQLTQLLAALATTGRPLAILVDDAQWLDPQSLDTMLAVAESMTDIGIRVVCAHRTPTPVKAPDTVHEVRLRPLHRKETELLLTRSLQARPSRDLRAAVHRDCRGIPALVLAAVAGHRGSGALKMIDQHAYVVPADQPPVLPPDSPVLRQLQRDDPLVWEICKALAVFQPLGDAVVGLIAEAIEADEQQVLTVLTALRAEGLLLEGPWRFRAPLLAAALLSCLGPYDARSLSALAVTAIWEGTAKSPDPRYHLDRLVAAGRLVAPDRAAAELLDGGSAHLVTEPATAARWLAAAAERSTDPDQRALAVLRQAASCSIAGDPAGAVANARIALARDVNHHPSGALLELTIIELVGLIISVGPDAVREFADKGWRSAPGGETNRLVARAAALSLLDQVAEAHDLLSAYRSDWLSAGATTTSMGLTLSSSAGLLGRWANFQLDREHAPQLALWQEERHKVLVVTTWNWVWLLYGELGAARRVLDENGLSPEQLNPLNLMLHASLAGRWDEALDLGRPALAGPDTTTATGARVVAHQHLAAILTARGLPNRARKMLAMARTEPPSLAHLLAGPDADLARLLGAPARARSVLTEGIEYAASQQLVVGVDELRWRLIELDLAVGDTDAARRGLRDLVHDAEFAGTERARRHLLLGRIAVLRDVDAAAEAVRLARRRGQLPELAGTLAIVCGYGLGDRNLLLEAYELYGELGALVPRALLRSLMRAQRVTVPGRQETVLETERLLARLVAEGLTNREVASLLETTEKSVEGRLSRLFQRIGYQSRAELANAQLTGELDC